LDEVTGEDMERLANRLAMLVSDDGEADNAGRAVGQLARRLGLSGGDLKAIMLAGAGTGAGIRPRGAPSARRLEQEIDALRRELREAREAAAAAQSDRDALVAENGAMRVAMYRQRAGLRLRRLVLGLGAIGVVAVAAGVAWIGPDLAPPVAPAGVRTEGGAPAGRADRARVAQVRGAGAVVFREPDRASAVVGRLAPGTRLLVRRMEWSGLMQWVPVEVDGRPGYVASTEVEIF
jgi:hypothetical protein